MNAMRCNRTGQSLLALATLAGAGLGFAPTGAQADSDWSFHIGFGDHPRRVHTVAVTSTYETRSRRVWIEPEYTERAVRVTVPAIVETREVPVYDHHGRVTGYRLVRQVIEPAHTERRIEQVVVRAGYYTTVTERDHVQPVRRRTSRHHSVIERHNGGTAVRVGFSYNRHRDRHHRRDHHERPLRRLIRAALRH